MAADTLVSFGRRLQGEQKYGWVRCWLQEDFLINNKIWSYIVSLVLHLCWHLPGSYWFILACVIAGEKMCLASRSLCVVTDFSNGKRLTQPPGPQQHEKKKKKKKETELRGKWVISKNHWIQNHRALRSRKELNDISNKSFPCYIYIFMFTRTAWLAVRDASVVDWLSVTFLSVVCEKKKTHHWNI